MCNPEGKIVTYMQRALLKTKVMVFLTLFVPVTSAANTVLVPAYGNPCCGSGKTLWNRLIQTARPGLIDIILNPQSGPGAGLIDPNYIGVGGSGPLLELDATGTTILGYVSTRWGDRELSIVLDEIDRYFSVQYYRDTSFMIDGIFIDEMSNDLSSVGYYEQIAQHIASNSASSRTIGNPGTNHIHDSSQGESGFEITDYVGVFDQLVVFENSSHIYRNQFFQPAWIDDFSAERFAHIIHSVANLERAIMNVEIAASRNVQTLFITNDVLPNPYDTVPNDWEALLSSILPAPSINELTAAIRFDSINPIYDLNQDGTLDALDRDFWIEQIAETKAGDANLDKRFDSADLIMVFQSGHYEDGIAENSLWQDGDWNGDGEFSSSDLVEAFGMGHYQQNLVVVPESTSARSVILAVSIAWCHVGRRHRDQHFWKHEP